MVVFLRRKLLRNSSVALLLAVALACGREAGAPEAAVEAEASSPVTLAGPIENGSPMPVAARAGGAAPYPGAVVWMRQARPPSEFRALEAFTPDSFPRVVAFYDSALAGWRRTIAKDAVHYHRDPDVVVVVVSPWDGENVPRDGPRPLRQARTSIGVAWRDDS